MTERLDRIEAICESNARAVTANSESIGELKNTVEVFLKRVDEEGLKVSLITDISDDQAGELAYHADHIEDNEQRIQALRADAIADRIAWRSGFDDLLNELKADRRKADEDRMLWQASFRAQMAEIQALGEQNRALLSALATTNGRVNTLEQAG